MKTNLRAAGIQAADRARAAYTQKNAGKEGYSLKALEQIAKGNYRKVPELRPNTTKATVSTTSSRGSLSGGNKTVAKQRVREHSGSGMNLDKQTRNSVNLPKTTPAQRPTTRYDKSNTTKNASTVKQSSRDTKYDKDFDNFYNYRFTHADMLDDYKEGQEARPYWQKVKEDIMTKNKWSEKEFDAKWDAYNKERQQKDADKEVSDAIEAAKKSPVASTLIQQMLFPQELIEGGAAALSNFGKSEEKAQSSSSPLFTGTRVRDAIKQTVKDEHIKSGAGKAAYDIGTGLADMAESMVIPILGTGSLGAKTAARTNMQALDRGVDPDKAAATAGLAGLTSGFMNKIGFNKAAESASLAKAAGIEGLENFAEDFINKGTDALINRSKSEIGALYNFYKAQGLDDKAAALRTALDEGKEEAVSAATGMALGGLMKGVPALAGMLGNKIGGVDTGKIPTEDVDIQNATVQAEQAATEIENLRNQLPELKNKAPAEDFNIPEEDIDAAVAESIGGIDDILSPEEIAALQDVVDGKYDIPETGETAPATDYITDLRNKLQNAEPIDKADALVDGGYYRDHVQAGERFHEGKLDADVEDYLTKMEKNGNPAPTKNTVDTNKSDYNLKEKYNEDYEQMRRGVIKEYTNASDAQVDKYKTELDKLVSFGGWSKADPAVLDDYVEHAPTYKGQISRGLHFEPGDGEYDKFMNQVHESGTITLGKPSSWTTDPETSRLYSHMGDDTYDSVEIVCNQNRTSTPINFINWQGEDEVLSSSKASWTVLNEDTVTRPNGSKKTILYVAETGDKTPPKNAVTVPDEVDPNDVIYHSGILSRLNKADTAGKMEGMRDTGYYGTGHYFVDQAHKSSIGKGTGYGDKPYSSVDISKYDNLYKADTDAKANKLHNFSQKMMRFINGYNDKYYSSDGEIDPLARDNYITDLYGQYLELFPDNHMNLADFENKLNDMRNGYEYDFYDRGDSAFTTFMKEHGYNGVDTRGTRSADTERGVVIYDLDEDSILQSNVTDADVKNGFMNTRVRNENPVFDTATDERIQGDIDSYNSRKKIAEEYRKLFDDKAHKALWNDITEAQQRISDLENEGVSHYKSLIEDADYLEEAANLRQKEFARMGLDEDIDVIKSDMLNYAKENIDEVIATVEQEKARLAEMQQKYDADEELSKQAYQQAKENVKNTYATERAEKNPTITSEPLDTRQAMPALEGMMPDEVAPVEEKIRSFSNRGSNDETLPDDIRNSLKEDVYKVVRNADTEAKAESLFDADNLTQTRSNLDRAIKDRDPAAASLSYKLAKAYIDAGDYDAATDVIESVSAELTRGGQFTQAAKLAFMQNDPMAAMRAYKRDLDKVNQWGAEKYGKKWQKLKLTEEDMDAFNSVSKGDKEALNNIVSNLNTKFSKQIPSTLWDKFVGATKTAMLLNTRTQIRNIAANMAVLPVRSISDRVSALGQNIAHLINPDVKVTQSLVGGARAQKKAAGELFDKMKDEIVGENKMKDSTKSQILSNKQTFNDDILGKWIDNATHGGLERLNQRLGAEGNKSTMETLANFTYWLMGDFGDTPFVKKNFVNRLASYMKAQGIDNVDDLPDDAIALATQEALKATFKDDNAFSKALQGVKQKTGKFGEVALPFVKTPANLAMRGIDYSPVGLINTFKKIKSGADAGEIIDDLSKNLTGSAMILLGYKLREKGLLTGNYSEDKDEKAFQKQQGMLENAFHVGDNYITYDWAQPTSTPLLIGSTIYDAVNNSDAENDGVLGALNTGFKGALNVTNSWLNTSPLQSVSDLLGGGEYSNDNGIAGNIANEIIEMPQRLIPAQLGAIARTSDPIMRDTYSGDQSLTGILGNQVRQAQAKVPELSKQLPISYDTWGNPRTRSDTKLEAFLAQNFNPGQLGNKNETPLDSEVQRLFDKTGNKEVFPINAARSLELGDSGRVKLTPEQHSQYQKELGQKSYELVDDFMKNPEYKNLTDDEKAATLGSIYNFSNELAKEKLFNHVTDNNSKLKEIAKTEGTKGVTAYYVDKIKADRLGMNVDTYRKKESEYEGGAAKYAETKKKADALELSVDTYDKKEAEYPGGAKQYAADKKKADALGITVDQYNKAKTTGGAEKFAADKKKAEQAGFVSKSGSVQTKEYQKAMDKAGKQWRKMENDLPVLVNSGLDKSAIYTYGNALNSQYASSINPSEYARVYNAINTNKDNGMTQNEVLDYLNKGKYTQAEADRLWTIYGDGWKQVPVLKNGTWTKKKKK